MKELDYVSTLSGYIHWKLTGNRVIGIGDAAGMFPVNSDTHDYCEDKVQLSLMKAEIWKREFRYVRRREMPALA